MDDKLSIALAESLRATLEKMESHNSKRGLPSPQKESSDSILKIARAVRRDLSRKSKWEAIRNSLAMDALYRAIQTRLPAAPIDTGQHILPGFEDVPLFLGSRSKRRPTREIPVRDFLKLYAGRARRWDGASRQQQQMARLAEALQPFKDTDLTVAQAIERAPPRHGPVLKMGK